MKIERAKKIANAVLYEGYILYPYRPSAVKNRQRWTFGGVHPQAYSLAQGGMEAWTMQTECLVVGDQQPLLEVRVRFLHLQERIVGVLDQPVPTLAEGVEPAFRPVESLHVGERVVHTWQEAVEREVILPSLFLDDLVAQPHQRTFTFLPARQVELLRQASGEIVGLIVRQQQAIAGEVAVAASLATGTGAPVFKLTLQIKNLTPLAQAEEKTRDEALLRSFVSTHAILGVDGGNFISLLDPPANYAPIAATCYNVGTYPVLVGEAEEHDLLLSSPIILYDYPQIAPESPFDLFDGTEIDEILTLRIMTLTDAEKQEVRQADERAGALLDQIEMMVPEQLMKLHGTMRRLQPVETIV